MSGNSFDPTSGTQRKERGGVMGLENERAQSQTFKYVSRHRAPKVSLVVLVTDWSFNRREILFFSPPGGHSLSQEVFPLQNQRKGEVAVGKRKSITSLYFRNWIPIHCHNSVTNNCHCSQESQVQKTGNDSPINLEKSCHRHSSVASSLFRS